MSKQNAFQCGCVIIWDDEVEDSYATVINPQIVYCPLHAAAPQLREALKKVEWEWRSSSGWSQAGKQCSWCLQYCSDDHAPDCPRQAALAAAEGSGMVIPSEP